ncbi:hypothetical protein Tsubulata_021700 [Turnera subulata]|uniref:DUF4378 domain-containing protein n=1 Tax=Turnera subulata TaxID=218843 RepID=A0A9Q0FQ25_9ROSI|nr:hypothetical protein Tsubulata_021700 [Turnera subulata]
MTTSTNTTLSNQKPFLIDRRPLMLLKDYLLDDLSSCSSNGFKSFPRRQCCTTVRFLLEKDLKTKPTKLKPPPPPAQHFKRRRPVAAAAAAASTKVSAFHRASEAVINAVKLLPFPSSSSVKSPSPSPSSRRGLFLPRSFSRRLFKKSRFWRKSKCSGSGSGSGSSGGGEEEDRGREMITRWRSFGEFLEERDKPLDQATIVTTTTTTTTTASRLSTSSSSDSNGNSNSDSWGESEFTGLSGNDAAEGEKDLVAMMQDEKEEVSDDRTDGGDSVNRKQEWPVEEKEQFSPVSVLDCPFQDEEEIASLFHSMEGTKNKLMHKIRRFENLTQLEPVDLEKRIAMAELDDESLESPSMATHNGSENDLHEIEVDNASEKGVEEKLLKLFKETIPSNEYGLTFKADSLLLDLFRERNVVHNERIIVVEDHKEIEMVQDWLKGHPQELFLGWEVKDKRHVYIKDMEKDGKWRNLDEDKEEVALEIEFEIFTSLVNEFLVDVI